MLNIKENITLAPYTTFKIGGPAKFFCEVGNEEELIEAINYAHDNNLEFFILGGGSNILVSDKGFEGLIIRVLQTKNYKLQTDRIECWAGDNLSSIVNFAAENELAGLEWAVGIPGTIGGAVRGNAGMPGGCMADCVESVKAIKLNQNDSLRHRFSEASDAKFKIYNNEECKFGYRNSIFKQNRNLIILSCILKLQKGNGDEIDKKIREIIKKRAEKIPKDPSPGSFFKNPVITDREVISQFEKDVGISIKDNQTLYHHSGEIKLPAGWLIEIAGFKGKKIGGAMVSEKHANFIVNTGNAKAEDIIMLASLIKQKIRDRFGVELKEEVQYLGF